MCELAAKDIICGRPYATSVESIVRRTGKTIDEVVLYYKLAVDFLSGRCALIRQAVVKVGSTRTGPDFSFPTVRVTVSQKRSLADRLALLNP